MFFEVRDQCCIAKELFLSPFPQEWAAYIILLRFFLASIFLDLRDTPVTVRGHVHWLLHILQFWGWRYHLPKAKLLSRS